ncbi:hypothetical protein KAS41_03875 [Candidatus Parcubacteria bacterium]|nr:hypothetical protein [Candidatus Parcubacteria bacterium]
MKKSREKKTVGYSNKQKEKMLWAAVALISGIIFLGWIYNFITSTNIRISNQQEKEALPQITDFKKQLEDIKSQFKEFNLKNATSSDAEIKNIQKEFNEQYSTSTKTNDLDAKKIND